MKTAGLSNPAARPSERKERRCRYGAVLMASCLLVSCSTVEPDRPSLPEAKVVAVLADLHLARSRAEQGYEIPPGLRDSIFAQHDVSPAQFEQAMRFYAKTPERYVQLYRDVFDHLSSTRAYEPPASTSTPEQHDE